MYNNLSNYVLLVHCFWMVLAVVCTTMFLFVHFFWCPCMPINASVQYNNGGLLPDIILLTQCYYHRGTRSNAMKRFCFCRLSSHLNVLIYFPPDWGMLRRSRRVQIFFKVQLECHENKRNILCGTAVQLEYHENKRTIFCGTAVQLEYPEEKRKIAAARGLYLALFVHSCLVFPPFPVVQQYNWSILKRNVNSSKEPYPHPAKLFKFGRKIWSV